MQLYTLDPMQDARWDDLASSHPRASVFHQRGWLKALAGTYGYRPMVLTTTQPGKPLSDGIVFCEVRSWITGNRLVSLPFADHADPLVNETCDTSVYTEWLRAECLRQKWKYIELRPLSWELPSDSPLVESQSFWFHTLSLTPSIDQLFQGLHKDCLQRRIRRAEREHLSYEKGCSEGLLNDFYRLLMITRRRHRLLPQPRAWFRNMVACMSPNVEIRLARKGGYSHSRDPYAEPPPYRGVQVWLLRREISSSRGYAVLVLEIDRGEQDGRCGADRFWPHRPE